MRLCIKCRERLPIERFGIDNKRPDGRNPYCKLCISKIAKARYDQRKDQAWADALRRKYGITAADYQAMLAEQHGRCKICGNGCSRKLAVDHNHVTGRVRGLLCLNCNRGIGILGDDPARLRAAADYLEESG